MTVAAGTRDTAGGDKRATVSAVFFAQTSPDAASPPEAPQGTLLHSGAFSEVVAAFTGFWWARTSSPYALGLVVHEEHDDER